MGIIEWFQHNTFSSLAIRNYRLFFIGQIVSLSGTWMQTVVLGWLVIELSGSGTQLGLVVALQFLPLLFLGPWGGVIVDRFKKRTILTVTSSLYGLLVSGMALLIFIGAIELWMLYVFAFLLGMLRIFENTAQQTFVAEMVPAGELKNAVSLNSLAVNLARVVGPTLGGALIAGFGMAFCFLFNALTYVVVLVILFMMRESEINMAVTNAKKSGQLGEGLRYMLADPLIKHILLMMAVIGTFAYEFQVSLPLLADQTFHGGVASYAMLLSAMGVGSVAGGLYAAGQKKVAPQFLITFAILFGLSIVVTALLPTLDASIAGMLFVGFFSINVLTLGNTMLQLECVPEMRGRVMALWGVALVGSTAIGGPIIGFIGEYAGARWGLASGGLITVLAAVIAAGNLLKKDKLKITPSVT